MKRFFCLLTLLTVLVACGGGSSSGPSADEGGNSGNGPNAEGKPPSVGNGDVPAGSNVVDLLVDGGPVGKKANVLYASVTICKPGSTSLCKTIDHVLVDTGSVGLRLLASEVPADLQLSAAKNTSGNVLLGCANFLDGSFAWGPLALADVKLGGLTASNTTVQLVGHSDYDPFQDQCSSGGDPIITAADLGAKGILGVGLSKQDCGIACRGSARNGKYFSCINADCTDVTGATLASDKQLQQVVARFPADNNGFAIQMDSVSNAGAATAKGKMIFGLGTRSNNQFPALRVLATNSLGLLNGELRANGILMRGNYESTFLDTGSNGIYFDSYLPTCGLGKYVDFYCPIKDIDFTVVIANAFAAQVRGSFTLSNGAALLQKGNSALPTLGGALSAPGLLDLGLPFFYGKTVVIGIDGLSTTGVGTGTATGPFYAL